MFECEYVCMCFDLCLNVNMCVCVFEYEYVCKCLNVCMFVRV